GYLRRLWSCQPMSCTSASPQLPRPMHFAPPSPVGRTGPYRTVQLSKIIDPRTERRRCVLRRKPVNVNGVVDYHTEMDLITHLGTHVEAPYPHGTLTKD